MAENINQNLHQERKVYKKSSLSIDNTENNPISQFDIWYQEAAALKTFEANAMVLSTVDDKGFPHSRIVLLKSYSDKGFIFYSNYNSLKGRDLEKNPKVSLLFFYEQMERQIRISGEVVKLSEEENDQYFYSRPLESQLGAMVSPQSSIIPSKKILEVELEKLKNSNKKPQRPKHWGGYLIKASYFEFWQGRPSRLHDRICFERHHSDEFWNKFTIAP